MFHLANFGEVVWSDGKPGCCSPLVQLFPSSRGWACMKRIYCKYLIKHKAATLWQGPVPDTTRERKHPGSCNTHQSVQLNSRVLRAVCPQSSSVKSLPVRVLLSGSTVRTSPSPNGTTQHELWAVSVVFSSWQRLCWLSISCISDEWMKCMYDQPIWWKATCCKLYHCPLKYIMSNIVHSLVVKNMFALTDCITKSCFLQTTTLWSEDRNLCSFSTEILSVFTNSQWLLLPEHMAESLQVSSVHSVCTVFCEHEASEQYSHVPVVDVSSSSPVRRRWRQMEELGAFKEAWKDDKPLRRGNAWGSEQQSTQCGWDKGWGDTKKEVEKQKRKLARGDVEKENKKQADYSRGREAGKTA